jgi:hypothetical protein
MLLCLLLLCSYQLDVNIDKAEDVLIHQKVLAEAKDPDKRPAFAVRFLRVMVFLAVFSFFKFLSHLHDNKGSVKYFLLLAKCNKKIQEQDLHTVLFTMPICPP